MATRELLFSVTRDDCDWSYTKGTGSGGQKKNKTSSAVHCAHRASGAHGYSEASRSQLDNKRDAFTKMVATKEFVAWHRKKAWEKMGILDEIEQAVKNGMNPKNLRLEIKVEGLWQVIPFDTPLVVDADEFTVE
jgi:protein subunit release factor B